MSIALIRGPEPALPAGPARSGIPSVVLSVLVQRASMAGKTIAVRKCRSESEVVDCLHRARDMRCELVMLDPGACACNDAQLQTALDGLAVPYIEVRDDHFGALEKPLSSNCGRLILVQGYGAQSYTVALSIALEHLGCSNWENNIHVGT